MSNTKTKDQGASRRSSNGELAMAEGSMFLESMLTGDLRLERRVGGEREVGRV